jgi:S-(hydroxymethyl)glutathione dehydrogenase/alcohol dehydrogenase
MKAAVCYEFNAPLRIEEVTLDAPQAGEVRVKLAATAVCHSDVSILHGIWGPQLPIIVGHEGAGIVDAVGAGVTLAQPGDHVVVSLIRSCGRCFHCALGESYLCEGGFALDKESRLRTSDGQRIHQGLGTAAFAEYTVVDQSQVVPIPNEMPLDRACLLGCGVITGLGAVTNTAQVPAGSSVVVIGAGGVGLNSVQGAALSGAYPIIALDTLDNKLEAARTFGATHTANVEQEDARKVVWELTDGRGADYVFVTVGSTAAVQQGLLLTRRGGALVTVGMPKWTAPAEFRLADFNWNGQRMLGSHMGSTRPSLDIPKLVDLYLAGKLKLDELITTRYPLEQLDEAIAAMEQGKALRNVIDFELPADTRRDGPRRSH